MIKGTLKGSDNIVDMLWDDEVTKIGLELYREFIVISPVDTGEFRGVWDFTPMKWSFRITNSSAYGIVLWYGGSDQAPNGTFDGAVDRRSK